MNPIKKMNWLLAICFGCFLMFSACGDKTTKATTKSKDVGSKMVEAATTATEKYDYETVTNDPLQAKIYTLKNGMKVYMSVNKKEPRIMTNIAVRAGSKHDPADATGLAHYLEHMMFKGTSKIGSLDWEKEKVLLQEIEDLYEQHRGETDPAKRKEIYAKIDKVSNDAAKLVAANEYDKMISSLGAKGTNAYTYVEQTVYVNDIPANELDKWLQIESERFGEIVLRLFHTELEAVYEEFNISQDRDTRKGNEAIRQELFPSHPYGLQSTIGKGEHLKNPSHVKIKEYFNKYYHPNNMAIVVSGDFDPDEMVAKIEKYFGEYKAQPIPEFKFEPQPELTKRVQRDVYGQQDEYVDFAYRFNTEDLAMVNMITGILYNKQAGLVDLNLIQKQKVLEADAWMWHLEDYLVFGMYGKARKGQSLREVEDLMQGEIASLKAGKFDEWLLDAVIKDKKLSYMKMGESNQGRVSAMTDAFIMGETWAERNKLYDDMSKITKQQVIDFAKKHLKDNYVIVYKHTGEDKNVMKVEKPSITPVQVNRETPSEWTDGFLKKKASSSLSPKFIDYKKDIKKTNLPNGLELATIKNNQNETFSLNYIVDMGRFHNKKLPIAITYLPYLGTDKYSAEELQKEFFKLGLSFDVFAGDDQAYVTLSGLEESLAEGIELFEHILANVQPDENALKGVIADILKGRENAKKDKRTILRRGMVSYARYGAMNPFTDKMSEAKLKALKASELTDMIKSLTSYKHKVFYYGTKSQAEVGGLLAKLHKVPAKLKDVPTKKQYVEQNIEKDNVVFVNFPSVQTEVLMLSKGSQGFNADEYIMGELYNNYFGFGLSSIMFQEIRESKALAYSTYSYYGSPSEKDQSHYFQSYVGTQADKMKEAIQAVRTIVNDMPVAEEQIEAARTSIMKKIESERVNDTNIYWTSQRAAKRGLDKDIREDVYAKMKNVSAKELVSFQQAHVKDRNFTILVLGDKERVDMDYLKSLGNVKEMSLEQVFGY